MGRHLSFVIFISLMTSHCAILHHVQVGDIDTRQAGSEFTVMVSETGVDLREAKNIAQAVVRDSDTQRDIEAIHTIIALFQFGPTTGYKVYNDAYTDGIVTMLIQSCPSGRISGLTSIRETRKYPVISGEITKIQAKCLGPVSQS